MFRNIYKTIVLGALALGALAAVFGVIFVLMGGVTISARPPHWPITFDVLHGVFKATIRADANKSPEPPDLTDPGLIALGAQHYNQVCSSCHGGPGLGQSPVALSIRPRPQHLVAVVDDFDDKELYQILRNGVRLSAMPAWPADSNFAEIWSVVAFLRAMPKMDAAAYARMTAMPQPGNDAPPIAWKDRGAQAHLKLHSEAPPLDEYLYASPSTGWRPIGLEGEPLRYCTSCHGTDGTGAVTGGHAPNLTIQSKEFLAERLRDYANGQQPSGIMATVASALSEPQIDALASYFAGLPKRTAAIEGKGDLAAGKKIALEGIPAVGLPACASCHSATARQALPPIPAIAGQNSAFLTTRLVSFSESAESTPFWNPMHNFSRAMSGEQVVAVSTYLASLPADDPLQRTPIKGDAAVGEDIANRICVTCHHTDLSGDGPANVPNLTLQSPDYLAWQLDLFRMNERDSSKMKQAAHRLSDDEVAALATYLSDRPTVKPDVMKDWESVGSDRLAAAQKLVTDGDPDRDLPACATCHVATRGMVPVIPILAGQYPQYIDTRLGHFADLSRGDWLGSSPMRRIASKLTGDERRALAEYFASQPAE